MKDIFYFQIEFFNIEEEASSVLTLKCSPACNAKQFGSVTQSHCFLAVCSEWTRGRQLRQWTCALVCPVFWGLLGWLQREACWIMYLPPNICAFYLSSSCLGTFMFPNSLHLILRHELVGGSWFGTLSSGVAHGMILCVHPMQSGNDCYVRNQAVMTAIHHFNCFLIEFNAFKHLWH